MVGCRSLEGKRERGVKYGEEMTEKTKLSSVGLGRPGLLYHRGQICE